jgi:uroporphyrinogen decarboxylase
MNKRDTLLSLISSTTKPDYTPAAFFLHFGPDYKEGQAAIDKHLEFFNYTGMDLLKIQYEQTVPTATIQHSADWANVPVCSAEHFEPTIRVVEGLVKAAKGEALAVLTLYSPFMWAKQTASEEVLTAHLWENPEAVKKGLEIMTENVLTLVRACKKAGVNGFYASTQGGESFHYKNSNIFADYIKPTDLTVWDELKSCEFNILHVCDYEGGYDDLTPFLDYPGQVVNCSLKLDDRTLTPKEASDLFKRPFMGGLERKGALATGTPDQVVAETKALLAQAPEHFMLGADCTVPGDTSWDNLKAAIDTAHGYAK